MTGFNNISFKKSVCKIFSFECICVDFFKTAFYAFPVHATLIFYFLFINDHFQFQQCVKHQEIKVKNEKCYSILIIIYPSVHPQLKERKKRENCLGPLIVYRKKGKNFYCCCCFIKYKCCRKRSRIFLSRIPPFISVRPFS